MKKWICLSAFLVALYSVLLSSSHAGVGRHRATGQAIWDAAVHGRTTTIGGSNGSMRVIGPAGGATAGSTAGSAKISGSGTVPVADKNVPVGITGEVAKDAIVGGVAGCLTGGAVGCVLGVATPLALAYVANSGVRLNPDTGQPEKKDPWACTVGPCYFWRSWVEGTQSFNPYFASPQAACDSEYAHWKAWVSGGETAGPVTAVNMGTQANPAYSCRGNINGNTNVQFYALQRGSSRALDSPTWYPITPQELKDELYKNDPPPGIVDELARHGNIVWTLGDPTRVTLTGPSEIKGPKTTTTNPDGSKRVSQDSTPLSYSGPSVTAGNTTRTTETFAPDGTPTGTTTETTEPGTEEAESTTEEVEEAPTDTALPPVPDLYTRKYPDGMEGIWNQYKDQLKNTSLVQLASQLMPNVGNGGTCPTWPVNLDLAEWAAYGTHDVAPPCWIWDVARAILILSALLLARALIFGG